jgi:heme exporter protein C
MAFVALQDTHSKSKALLLAALPASLMTAHCLAIFVWAPTEQTMGTVQRIMYVHVAVAWLGLTGLAITAASGLLYLLRRDLLWDHWSLAAAELGWLSCTLTLATGSLWASHAWNTWWTWDPRLTTVFILWLIYSGYLIVRSSQEDVHRRARTSAVLAIAGVLDVPLVVLATRWFRGMHPAAPEMEPAMRGILWFSAASLFAFFALLLVLRQKQIRMEHAIISWERAALEQ